MSLIETFQLVIYLDYEFKFMKWPCWIVPKNEY